MRRRTPKKASSTEKEAASSMGNQDAKAAAKPAAAASSSSKPAAASAAPKEVTPQQLSSALEKVLAHSLQNKPGTPEYILKHANDDLVALQPSIVRLEKDVANGDASQREALKKQMLVLEESCMKILLSVDAVSGDVYREQRRAVVKAVQEWQQRLDEAKKVFEKKAAM